MSGWIGRISELRYVLSSFGADRDGEGCFIITGEAPVTFMGETGDNAEVVVSAKCMCRIGGRETAVVGLLHATSYGLKVTVI